MGVICPHNSARNMRIMWMNLVQISPFSDGLHAQQLFKITHVDFGMVHDSRDVPQQCTSAAGISRRAD